MEVLLPSHPIPIGTLHGASRCAHTASAAHPALQHKRTHQHLSQKARLCTGNPTEPCWG